MLIVSIIFLIALLFIIITICLFNGKCSWLIAGYNTASKNEKKVYDEKKLCKAAGLITLLSAVLLSLIACLGYLVENFIISENIMFIIVLVFVIIFLIAVFGIIRYMNEKCKIIN